MYNQSINTSIFVSNITKETTADTAAQLHGNAYHLMLNAIKNVRRKESNWGI